MYLGSYFPPFSSVSFPMFFLLDNLSFLRFHDSFTVRIYAKIMEHIFTNIYEEVLS